MLWLRSFRRWGWKITLRNIRFQLGYSIGGFTCAWNYTEQELRDGEAHRLIEDLSQYVQPRQEVLNG